MKDSNYQLNNLGLNNLTEKKEGMDWKISKFSISIKILHRVAKQILMRTSLENSLKIIIFQILTQLDWAQF